MFQVHAQTTESVVESAIENSQETFQQLAEQSQAAAEKAQVGDVIDNFQSIRI